MTEQQGQNAVAVDAIPAGSAAGMSLEAEERAMRKGKGRMIAGMIVAGVAVIAALAFAMKPKAGEEYRTFGRNVNGLDQRQFDAFWACTIRGVNMNKIRNNQELAAQINVRGTRGKARWATVVRDECMPKLDALQDQLTVLIPPEDQTANLSALRDGVRDLRAGVSDLVGYITGIPEGDVYVESAATRHVDALSKGWYDYRRALKAINDAIKAKIGE